MKNPKTSLAPLQPLHLLVPVLRYYQGPAASSQRPAASAIYGDEVSEYSDEYTAQSQDSGRTVLYPDLYVLTDDEHRTMTPETHKCAAAAAGSFCDHRKWRSTGHIQIDHYAECTTIIVRQ